MLRCAAVFFPATASRSACAVVDPATRMPKVASAAGTKTTAAAGGGRGRGASGSRRTTATRGAGRSGASASADAVESSVAGAGAGRHPALESYLDALAARRASLEEEVARCDARVFHLETRYLDAVCFGRPGYVGCLMDGWAVPPHMSSSSGAMPAATDDAGSRHPLGVGEPRLAVAAATESQPSSSGEPNAKKATRSESATLAASSRTAAALVRGGSSGANDGWRYPASLRVFTLSSASALANCEALGLEVV